MFPRRSSDLGALSAVALGTVIGLSFLAGIRQSGPALMGVHPELTPVPTAGEPVTASPSESLGETLAVPVQISSGGSGFSVIGDYRGELELTPEGLVFRIERAEIGVRPDRLDGEQLDGIRVGLANRTSKGWHTPDKSALIRIDEFLSPGETVTLTDVELLIPGVRLGDLELRWLVVEHELSDIPSANGGAPGRAWTYAHSDLSVIERLRYISLEIL